MGTLILRLEIDPATKKKNVVIKYDSDSDALPMEHEEQHKKLVEALIAGGKIKPGELGTIVVERESGGTAATGSAEPAPPQREPVGNKG